MSTLEVQISEEAFTMLDTEPKSLARELVLLAAVKLFEMGRLSSGQAAKMVGISRVELLARLREYRVSPFQLDAAELHQDVLNA